MKNFILVHGAWHGSWVWHKIVPRLQQLKINVWCPTLAGFAERADNSSKNITLSDHICEIQNLIISNKLNDVVLIGHSYGGMVITGVANNLPERIAKLVYVDAIIPESNQSLLEIFGENHAYYAKVISFIPPKTAQEFGLEDAEEIAWATAKYTKQPLKTFSEKLNFSPENLFNISKAYIACTKRCFDTKWNTVFQNAAATAKNRSWDYFELNTGHSCMLTMPDELAAIFLMFKK
jgi:pimeloyl-ACP methyl ester carboxylesterase